MRKKRFVGDETLDVFISYFSLIWSEGTQAGEIFKPSYEHIQMLLDPVPSSRCGCGGVGSAAWWCMIYYNSSPCLHYSDTDASPAQLNTTLCSFIITTTGRVEGRYSDCLSELQSPSLDIRYNNIAHCANNNNNYNNCNNITLLLLSKSNFYIHKQETYFNFRLTRAKGKYGKYGKLSYSCLCC